MNSTATIEEKVTIWQKFVSLLNKIGFSPLGFGFVDHSGVFTKLLSFLTGIHRALVDYGCFPCCPISSIRFHCWLYQYSKLWFRCPAGVGSVYFRNFCQYNSLFALRTGVKSLADNLDRRSYGRTAGVYPGHSYSSDCGVFLLQ